MGLFNDKKNSLDEKKYKQILAEEELEEEYFNRENSFKKYDESTKKEEKKEVKEVKVVKEYQDDTDYDYYSDYSNFNTIKEDYDNEEDVYIDVDDEEDNEEDGYVFDKSLIVSIVSSIYKWFAIVAIFLAVCLIIYLLFKAKYIAILLYVLSLICAFLFGYVLMFAINYLFFKE